MSKFTAETARILAARGVAARKANAVKRHERLKHIDAILAHAAKVCEENETLKTALRDAQPEQDEVYRNKRLSRVRKQLELVDGMIEVETDAAKLDRLASAASRLNEQERQLSNRSLPPTVKAPAGKPRRQSSPDFSPKPIEIAPKPVAVRTEPGVSTDSTTQSSELPPL
jgi:hypothetical protein